MASFPNREEKKVAMPENDQSAQLARSKGWVHVQSFRGSVELSLSLFRAWAKILSRDDPER